jgi:type VI secretion system protein ImpH
VSHLEEPDPEQSYFRLDVTFMGLYGVSTPLPLHYAIDVLRSVDQAPTPVPTALPPDPERPGPAPGRPGEPAGRGVLDIFHHRLISLFYRAGTKSRYDRLFGLPGRDTVTDYLFWLIGCPRSYDRATLGVEPIRLLRYAGILTQQPRSSATLEGLLVDYWETIPIECLQFDGRWLTLATTDLNRLGMANSRLGVDLTVGEQVFDLSGAFRIVAGPVDWPTYVSFLPDGKRYQETRALSRLYSLDPLAFSIEVRLRAGEVPETRLSSSGQAGRLGYTSWVRTQEVGETSVVFDCTQDRTGG